MYDRNGENQTQHIGTNGSSVKHGGGGLMIWAHSAATGPRHLAVIESTANYSLYQSIFESNVKPPIQQLKLDWNWVNNRTVILNAAANLQQNVWKRQESRCSRGPVKVQTSTRLKCRGGNPKESRQTNARKLKRLKVGRTQTPLQWCKKRPTGMDYFKLLLLKVALQSCWIIGWTSFFHTLLLHFHWVCC